MDPGVLSGFTELLASTPAQAPAATTWLPLADIDDVRLNFNDSSLVLLNIVLAFLMFGIALDTRTSDFRAVAHMPKAMAVGIAAQFILLPATSFGLSILLGFSASISMGMILVACCPPGAISNILTYRSGGDVALSVSMTAIANLMAIFLMPLNIALWGSLHPKASAILTEINLSALEMLGDILLILGIPFAIGMTLAHRHPGFAAASIAWVRRFSLMALLAFILIAFFSNLSAFFDYIPLVAVAVFLQDTMALSLGYGIAASFGVPERARRAITFEVGVRNTGLGLGIVFSFFGGLGGMAMVAGWWGIWDIIAGLILAGWWARRTTDQEPSPAGPEPALAAERKVDR